MQNGNGKNYVSTQEAAFYCHVTRFTIVNWIKLGFINATKTAGGHRRITRDDLLCFMRMKNMDYKEVSMSNGMSSPENGFKWCWEYHKDDGYKKHKCRGCLVYLTHTKRCFSLRKKYGHKRIFCNSECNSCSYYKKYYDKLEWCWEYHQENCREDHKCQECVVYQTGTKKCFALREEVDHKKIFCKKDCNECSYYRKQNGG